jgi:hypothetical protein
MRQSKLSNPWTFNRRRRRGRSDMGEWWCCEADYPYHTKECPMGERRFVIIECSAEIYEGTVNSIIETEFMKRINKALHTARVDVTEHITNEDEVIDILLYGEAVPPAKSS